MGSRNYQYTADHIDNGLEKSFRKVFAVSKGSSDTSFLPQKSKYLEWKPTGLTDEDREHAACNGGLAFRKVYKAK